MLSTPSVAAASWGAAPADSSSSGGGGGGVASRRVRLRMTKLAGERSFGLTLEQRCAPCTPLAAVVSYVFPGSPAARVGIQRGWLLLRINRRSVEGLAVKEVAPMFRDVKEIELEMEPHAYDAAPSGVDAVFAGAGAGGFSLPFLQSPLLHQPQVVPRAPPAVTAAPTGSRAVLSPGSALGVSASAPSLPPRAAAAPIPPELLGSSRDPPPGAAERANAARRAQAPPTAAPPPHVPPVVASAHSAVSAPAPTCPTPAAKAGDTTMSSQASDLHQFPAPAPSASPSNEGAGASASAQSPATQVPPPPQVIRPTPVVTARRAAVVSAEVPTPAQPSMPAQAAKSAPVPRTAPAPAPVRASTPTAAPAPAPTQASTPTPAPTPAMPSQVDERARSARNGTQSLFENPSALHEAKPVVESPRQARPSPPTSAAPSPVTPSASSKRAATSSTPSRMSSGKKRARPTGSSPPSSSDDSTTSSTHRGRVAPRNRSSVPDDSDDSDDASAHTSSLSGRRNARRRQARGGGMSRRPRVKLTVDHLVRMGFTREDANASVTACGHNLDACMVWIVSHLEEQKFLNDLNEASRVSELSKRAEEQERKEQEQETLMNAKEFTALFTTSYMLSDESTATRFKEMLSGAIGDVRRDSFLRVVLTKLLTLEAQAIKWYKLACKCYLLQLAERLESGFGGHDLTKCCSTLESADAGAPSGGCAFVRLLHDEERKLSKVLFEMPENEGGAPLAFLKADKDTQFSIDDDGFEVLEVDGDDDDDDE